MNARALFSVAILLLTSLPGQAATVSFAGGDFTTSGAWRTSAILKSLDGDGNNVYGSDGYVLTGGAGSIVNPSYATVLRLSTLTFPGNGGYTLIDNPLGPGSISTGVWYSTGSITLQEQNLAQITVTSAGSFRVGILTDNADFADISPFGLHILQTSGGSGDSGLIGAYLEPNRDSDWYFFDIVGAQIGDVFVISGTNTRLGSGPQDSNGIGALTFDRLLAVPEPATYAAGVGCCLLLGSWMRRRR